MVYQCLSYFIVMVYHHFPHVFFFFNKQHVFLFGIPVWWSLSSRGSATWPMPWTKERAKPKFVYNFRRISDPSSFFFPKFFCNSLNLQTRKSWIILFLEENCLAVFPRWMETSMQRAWSALESAEQVLSTGPGPLQWRSPVESDGKWWKWGEDMGFLWISIWKLGRRSAPKGSYMGS